MAFAQDSAGFMWIGTQVGLARWDGHHSKLFHHDPQDAQSLPDDVVTALEIGPGGEVIIASGNGVVSSWDSVTQKFNRLPATDTGIDPFSSFALDGRGGYWWGSSSGLSHWRQGDNKWNKINLGDATKVLSVFKDKHDVVWVGTDKALFFRQSDQTKFEEFNYSSSGKSQTVPNVSAIGEGPGNAIWIGTHSGAVARIDEESKVTFVAGLLADKPISSISLQNDRTIAIGTAGDGLYFVNTATISLVRHERFDPMRPTGLANDRVYRLFRDRLGDLWIGHISGADYIPNNHDAFANFLPSERSQSGLNGDYIVSILPRQDGTVWIATENGRDLYSSATGRVTKSASQDKLERSLPKTQILAMANCGSETEWVATANGLFEVSRSGAHRFEPTGSEPIRSLYCDKHALWIGTQRSGLGHLDLDTREYQSFRHEAMDATTISNNFVLSILRDPKRGLWIATFSGLNLWDGTRFQHFVNSLSDEHSIPNDTVTALEIDRQDRLWIGTWGGGLAFLAPQVDGKPSFERIPSVLPQGSSQVISVLSDLQGCIWASTADGVLRIDSANNSVRHFGVGDGLATTSFPNGLGARVAEGVLYFGGVGGLLVIRPSLVSPPANETGVAATEIRFNGSEHASQSEVVLLPYDHNFEIELASLDFAAPDQAQFAHRLRGFEENWVHSDDDHRVITYTNLPPGRYDLQLLAANHQGLWTSEPVSFPITVMPRWFETLWFKLGLAFALLLAVFLLVRARTSYLRKRQVELEAQVSVKTQDIASLLHNSGEGFLSFGSDLLVRPEVSAPCTTFLGFDPRGKNIAHVLYPMDPRQVSFLTDLLASYFSQQDISRRGLILSLAPSQIERDGRLLSLRFTGIEGKRLMAVLRDMTEEIQLRAKLGREHKHLEMTVTAVTEPRDFFDLVESFTRFVDRELSSILRSQALIESKLALIYRQIHTYKGSFDQFNFDSLPSQLHTVETQLSVLQERSIESEEAIYSAISPDDLIDAFEHDMNILRSLLGENFVERGYRIDVSTDDAGKIRRLAAACLGRQWPGEDSRIVQDSLQCALHLGYISLGAAFKSFERVVRQISDRLDKNVNPLLVTGDTDVMINPTVFGAFLRSLEHVFRNALTHGIESPEFRIRRGKDENGTISCHIEATEHELILELTDDGAGIDVVALRQKLVEKGVFDQDNATNLPESALLGGVFADGVSTASELNAFSGRGVGLSAVKSEVTKLGGKIEVRTVLGSSTTFRIVLPRESDVVPVAH